MLVVQTSSQKFSLFLEETLLGGKLQRREVEIGLTCLFDTFYYQSN